VGQIAKQLTGQQSGPFSVNIETNLKHHCNLITTRSGKVVGAWIAGKSVVDKDRKDE